MNAETLVSSLCNWLRRVFGRERESETDPLASAERKKKSSVCVPHESGALRGLDEERWIRYACQWEKIIMTDTDTGQKPTH